MKIFTSTFQVLAEVEEEQDSSGRESEEGPLIYPDFEYEVTLIRSETLNVPSTETFQW